MAPAESIIIDLPHRNRPLLIAFGGMVGALGMPPFEFFNLTKDLDINKVYLRDLNQAWYHAGISGISTSIDETASFLRGKIDESGASKVVLFGNSMGGYAAIIFGILLKADSVHAFSPQTSLKDERYIRSKERIQYVINNFSNEYFDLKEIIEANPNLGEFNVYYNSGNELDKKHAMHLDGLKNIVLHSFDGDGHDLVKKLRQSGELEKIVISSLNDARD